MKIVLNDENVMNDYGFYIRNSGIDLSRFKNNNVLLAFHHGGWMPVGRVNDVAVEGSQLTGVVEWDEEDKDPMVVALIGKYKRGFMKAFSMGAMILKMVEETSLMGSEIKYVATESELYELSCVTIPSNKNAVKLMNKDGLTLTSQKGELITLSFAENKLNFLTQNKEVSMKEIIKALGLPDTANEMDCVSHITKLKSESDLLKKEQVENLVKLGKQKGVITDANEASHRILLNSSFEAAKAVIESAEMPKTAAVTEGANVEGVTNLTTAFKTLVKKSGEGEKVDEKETFDWLQRNDPKKLASIKATDLAKYNALVAAYSSKKR